MSAADFGMVGFFFFLMRVSRINVKVETFKSKYFSKMHGYFVVGEVGQ